MKHYGDITKIKGNEVPIVDVITGGSPCQDLSIGGDRSGLAGERSGLFLEQIRIVREIHDECRRTNQPIRPRFLIWENVTGCTTTNGGEDFRTVLQEVAQLADRSAVIPRLADGDIWSNSGTIMADRWSIAWRVHDAQFWGLAQRRRRLSLVADFRGQTAPEILFEREDLQRNSEQSNQAWQAAAARFRADFVKAISFHERAGCEGGGKGILIQEELTGTLSTVNKHAVCIAPSFGLGRAAINQSLNSQFDLSISEEIAPPLIARGPGGVAANAVVRRLTPKECERLQGFPDDWTNLGDWIDSQGVKHKTNDTERYKALGNSIAVGYANEKKGFWCWLADRIVNQLKAEGIEEPTMASLFDGIGGFPLAFSAYGCKPVWASEIEEFPIAVTKRHFPEGDEE